jgi:glutamate synthase domain-containing protein 2
LGKKTEKIQFNQDGSVNTKTDPQITLATDPIMFSAMSYGSISKKRP